MHDAMGSQYNDRTNGWHHLVDGHVEVLPVPGDHLTLMEEPHVKTTAETLLTAMCRSGTKRLGNGDRGPGSGEPRADLHEGPPEAGTQAEVAAVTGRGGEAIRVGFGTEFGGAGVVQGEVGLGAHHSASRSVRLGRTCEWMRTCSVPGVPTSGARTR